MPVHQIIQELFEEHVRGSLPYAIVADKNVMLCRLTNTVYKQIEIEEQRYNKGHDKRVFISTRVVKHLFDKKPAEEFHFLMSHGHKVVKYPDRIYKNKDPKRGDICLTKTLHGALYLCSLEILSDRISVVTIFRVRKSSYLDGYKLLWSWRDGTPSS